LVRSYAWGLDLSASLSCAGGVGGLAWVTLHTASGSASGTHFTCYDGNGNIVALVSGTSGDVTGRYEYVLFGMDTRISDRGDVLSSFRFSTERTDNTADFVLDECLIYSPGRSLAIQRSVGGVRGGSNSMTKKQVRPKYAELLPGGPNLYGFVHNDPVSLVDADGRAITMSVVAAVAVIAAVEARTLPQHKAAFNRYAGSGDKFKHCWVSCRISRTCGGAIAEFAGPG